MKQIELLKSMEYLFLLLENGLRKPAHDIVVDAQIDLKSWHKLLQGEIIERIGSAAKPIYKWVARQPDLDMATEILKEYPELIRDVIFPNEDRDTEKNQFLKMNIPFEIFWNMYDKKEDRLACENKWRKLTNKERQVCISRLPEYIKSTPNKMYRKNPFKYINNKSWENEIVKQEYKPLKTETMLHGKDRLFNWIVPENKAGRRITEDLRINVKHCTLYLGYSFIDANYPDIDRNNVKVSFLLNEGEDKFLVINPSQGVPFFKFNASTKGKDNKHKSPALANKSLVIKFVKAFQLKGDEIKAFKLSPFQRINGMMLYSITSV